MKQVALISSGLGHVKRGFETNIQKHYDRLQPLLGDQLLLLKGGGSGSIPNFRQHGFWAKWLGKLFQKHPFEIQNYSFFLGSIYWILRYRPQVIYLGEPILYRLYAKLRNLLQLNFRMIYFSGGGVIPKKTHAEDTIQFVVPPACIGVDIHKVTANTVVLPHYVDLFKNRSAHQIQHVSASLHIPTSAKIILSVGALDRQKRMDYLIQEVAHAELDCFLILLGQEESDTPDIRRLAQQLLPDRHVIGTVPHHELATYYALADVFVLASLKEGFGLVYLEALSFGLPVLAHDYPISRHVLKKWGFFGDFQKKGALQQLLLQVSKIPPTRSTRQQRRAFVQENYSWNSLKEAYLELFLA